jgi:hypothetical protein
MTQTILRLAQNLLIMMALLAEGIEGARSWIGWRCSTVHVGVDTNHYSIYRISVRVQTSVISL